MYPELICNSAHCSLGAMLLLLFCNTLGFSRPQSPETAARQRTL